MTNEEAKAYILNHGLLVELLQEAAEEARKASNDLFDNNHLAKGIRAFERAALLHATAKGLLRLSAEEFTLTGGWSVEEKA